MAEFPSFESRTVTIDGVNIHYVCGGSCPPLVLVHGLGSSAAVEFYYTLEPLAAHHRVLAIDLPGFGKSDKPVLDYTIDLFVKAVRDLMACETLERAAVMGVSMGGRVALGLALESPELVCRLLLEKKKRDSRHLVREHAGQPARLPPGSEGVPRYGPVRHGHC